MSIQDFQYPEIRCDDVLQHYNLTKDMRKYVNQKSLFEWFKEADEPFGETDYPMTLAILEEGLNKEQEWVDYIKQNQHRYKIELHGLNHTGYAKMSPDELKDNLLWAKKRIESEFGVKVSTWYVPWGRRGKNEFGEDICSLLGLKQYIPNGKVDAKLWLYGYYRKGNPPFGHCNFHYWRPDQNNYVKEIIKICQEKKELQ